MIKLTKPKLAWHRIFVLQPTRVLVHAYKHTGVCGLDFMGLVAACMIYGVGDAVTIVVPFSLHSSRRISLPFPPTIV